MRARGLTRMPAAALVATCALVVSGCMAGGAEKAPPGVVRVAIGEPRHLLPASTSDPAGAQVLAALFTPLVAYNDKNEPYEVAAQSVTTTDNITWTIKLKPEYTFHNGEKVTSDSYLNAWNYAAAGKNEQENSYFFDRIAGYAALNPDGSGPLDQPDAQQDGQPDAKAEGQPDSKADQTAEVAGLSGLHKVDDLTFTVTLSAPFGGFRTMLGATPFYPLPKAAFASAGALRKDFEQAPIGDGPFRMKGTWHAGSSIEVERYAKYPGDQPKIKGAIFKIYGRLAESYADLVGGNIDVITEVPAANVASARKALGDRYQRRPAADLNFLAFPAYDEEFAKPDVRRAISMAIDRDAIAKSVFDDAQAPARSFVAPVAAGYRPDACGPACKFDPKTAKQVYADAGGPAKLRITYNADGGHESWVDAVCAQLTKNLGVPCEGVAEPTFAALTEKLKSKQVSGMFRMRSMMSFPSMADYLSGLYSTAGAANYFGYSNPRFDQLLREGDAAAKPADAIGKYQTAENLLSADLPVIPLRFDQADFAYSQRVSKVHTDLFDRVDLTTIECPA